MVKSAPKNIKDGNESKNLDVLVIGDAGIITFVFEDKFQAQHIPSSINAEYIYTCIGGRGVNTSIGLARYGLSTSLVTRLGNDQKATNIKGTLEENNVSTSLIKRGEKQTSQSIILKLENAEDTIINYRGAADELLPEDIKKGSIKRSMYVLVNHLVGRKVNLLRYIASICAIEDTRLALSIGLNEILYLGNPIADILEITDVLVLNNEEARALYHTLTNKHHKYSQRCIDCIPDTENILTTIKSFGVGIFCITDGNKSVKCIDLEGNIISLPSKRVNYVDKTGAGDAFFSAFLAGIIKGHPVLYSLERGINNASSVMEFIGPQTGLLYY